MTKRSIRFSDKEESLLQELAEAGGVSVSELIRERLFNSNPPVSSQVSAAQIVTEPGKTSPDAERKLEKPGPVSPPLSTPETERRLEKLEREIGHVAGELVEIKRLLLDQNSRPFGLDLPFVQAAFMASFTLARGSFSHCPAEWEPFKEEAWCRAFAPAEGKK